MLGGGSPRGRLAQVEGLSKRALAAWCLCYAAAALRDWLIAAGYLPSDEIEVDTQTEGEG